MRTRGKVGNGFAQIKNDRKQNQNIRINYKKLLRKIEADERAAIT